MHVAHLTLPFEYACGISRHVLTLASAQKQTDRVTVVTCGGGATDLLDHAGIPWRQMPVDPQKQALWDVALAVAALSRFAKQEQVTVLHAHHRYHAVLARATRALVPRLRIVATCHSLVSGRHLLSYPVPRVIAVSSAACDHLHNYFGIPLDRITVIPNALPLDWSGDSTPLDARVVAPSGAVILGVGRLSAEKGFDVLIEAAHHLRSRVPAPRIVLVGDGPEGEALRRSAKRAPIPVIFVGAVPSVRPYLEHATVLVQPSFSETSSLSILQAGQVGLPVVATNVGGIPEIIQHEVSGLLVAPGNAEALARAIDQILDDAVLSTRLGQELHRVAERVPSPAQMAAATQSVYAGLFDAKR